MSHCHIRAIALTVMLLALTGCLTTEKTLDEAAKLPPNPEAANLAVKEGETALARQDYDWALSLFQRALRLNPESIEAKLYLAEAYLGLGAYDDALKAFRSVGDHPDFGLDAQQGKGIVLLFMGETEEAQKILQSVVAERYKMWRAWNALGRALDGDKKWLKADGAYRAALATAPGRSIAIVHNNRGVSAMAREDFAAAIQHFGKAVELDPYLEVAEANLRLALGFRGRYAEAMSGVAPKGRADALNNLGFVAMMQGDHARAEAYFLQALESSPAFHETASRNLEFLANLKQVHSDTKASPQRAAGTE